MHTKTLLAAVTLSGCFPPGQPSRDLSAALPDTPKLHQIDRASFAIPYSCNEDDLSGDYGTSALFLTAVGRERNAPELLYNGSCAREGTSFESGLAGSAFGLVADLGDVPLSSVSASAAFNYDNISGADNVFLQTVDAIVGHTYASLVADTSRRVLFAFRLVEQGPLGDAEIDYSVLLYEHHEVIQEASGFDWNARSER